VDMVKKGDQRPRDV